MKKSSAVECMNKKSSAVSPVAVLRGHGDSVVSLKFLNLVRSLLVSGDSVGGLMMWDMHVYKAESRIIAHEKSIVSINVVNSLSITTSSRDGIVKLWDIDNMRDGAVPTLTLRIGHDHFCNSVPLSMEQNATHSEDASQLITPGIEQSEIFVWDLRGAGQKTVPSIRLTASDGVSDRSKTVGMVTALDATITKKADHDSHMSNSDCASGVEDEWRGICSTSHAVVAGGYEDGSVCMFDLRMTHKPLCRTKVHDEPIFALRIAPSGSSLVTGGGDSYLCKSSLTFNSAQGIVATHFIKQDQRISIQEPGTSCVRYRSDGRLLVSTHWDSTVRIFQTKNMKPLAILSHHRDSVYSVDFQHKDRDLDGSSSASPVVFATGSKDRTIAVWDTFGDTYKER